MTVEYPFPVPEMGLVESGHISNSTARSQAADWLVSARGLDPTDAADAVDGVYVGQAWFDEESRGFVGEEYPYGTVVPVTVVCGLYQWLWEPGETPPPEMAAEQ